MILVGLIRRGSSRENRTLPRPLPLTQPKMLEPGQDFVQQTIDEKLLDDLTQLVRLAVREDLDRGCDLTTMAVVPDGLPAKASIVARESGVAAGIDLIAPIVQAMESSDINVDVLVSDGTRFQGGSTVAVLRGEARNVLTGERIVLNFLGKLCGIATWTDHHVSLIADCKANLYDTRKTTPGWRRLEKYATNCGGACNHRSGLYEAVMVKDNHLACHARKSGILMTPSEAIKHTREFLQDTPGVASDAIIEIEVDSLEQLEDALPAGPDIVLLDNMSVVVLKQAVLMRDQVNPGVQLEASGGVTEETLPAIARTGVERISMGALTHSAVNLDLGLDWDLG